MINTNVINQIDNIKIDGKKLTQDGQSVLNKLYNFVDNPTGGLIRRKVIESATDLRMLTWREIASATKLSKEAAKEVQRALIQAHLDTPVALRGAGDALIDLAMKNPLQRAYQRVQGALRYTWNPFFRVQEVAETKLLAASLSNGMTLFNPIDGNDVKAIVDKMEALNIIEGSRTGEAATNIALGRISANLTRFQKNDLARYVDFMAQKLTNGNVDELLRSHTNEVIDAVRPIVQYPTRGVLNSNLARAVNLAAFPARYNVKVASLAVKVLAQQPPMVQAAVIRGIADFQSWLSTPDGLAWRQDYANEIAALKWLTPVGSLDWTMKALTGNFNSWREVGMIGGLPFGIWTTILTNQGILPEQPPYVDPKSGAIFSRKLPVTLKGRMASAIMDMLSSVYTYPGRTLMLPSKSDINKEIAFKIVGQGREDFETKKYTPADLTEKSRREQQFWYNRRNSPQPITDNSIKEFNAANAMTPNVIVQSNPERIKKLAKSELAKLPKASGETSARGKKKKVPVPFEQIVNR